VAVRDKSEIREGTQENAVDYGGRVFLFSSPETMTAFKRDPRKYIDKWPQVPPTLGLAILGPPRSGKKTQANMISDMYGFQVVDLPSAIERGLERRDHYVPPTKEEIEEARRKAEEERERLEKERKKQRRGKKQQEVEPPPSEPVEEEEEPPPPDTGDFQFYPKEREAVIDGKELSSDAIVRCIACELGLFNNWKMVDTRKKQIEGIKKEIEAAKEAPEGTEPPEYPIDEETGEPIVELEGPLEWPSRGFVVCGAPMKEEEIVALEGLNIKFHRILAYKALSEEEDAPSMTDILRRRAADEHMLLEPAVEAYDAQLDALGERVVPIPLEPSIDDTFCHVRKAFDPFFIQPDDPSHVEEPIDPYAEPEEAEEEQAEEEEGEEGETVEKPPKLPLYVPWGETGLYCPVTLRNEKWLVPGKADFQVQLSHKQYRLFSEPAMKAFSLNPAAYIHTDADVPPPRLMFVGPSGCMLPSVAESLADKLKIPQMGIEQTYTQEYARLEAEHLAGVASEKERLKNQEPIVDEEGNLIIAEEGEAEGEGEEEGEPELDPEVVDSLQRSAMRNTLHAHTGALIIDGNVFAGLVNTESEEIDEENVTNNNVAAIMARAGRLPDCVVILEIDDATAIDRCLNLEQIDLEAEREKERKRQEKEAIRAEKLREREQRLAAGEEVEEEEEEADQEEEEAEEGAPKASEKAIEQFTAAKRQQEAVLALMRGSLDESRVPIFTVKTQRSHTNVMKMVEHALRPYVQHRNSLIEKHQCRSIDPLYAERLQRHGHARLSRFRKFNPTGVDRLVHPSTYEFPLLYRDRIYYVAGSFEEREASKGRIVDLLQAPDPSPVETHPAIVVMGPPLSGKSTLAAKLAEKTGAIVVTGEEVLSGALQKMDNQLALHVDNALKSGGVVGDELMVASIVRRLSEKDCLERGWILDGLPLNVKQATLLSRYRVIPHNVFVLQAGEELTFQRCQRLIADNTVGDVQDSRRVVLFQREALNAYTVRAPQVQSYYSQMYSCVSLLPGDQSLWRIYDAAMKEAESAIARRHLYHRLHANKRAAPCSGLGWTPRVIQSKVSPWRTFCPVALTVKDELVDASGDFSFAVEFKGRIFWLQSHDSQQAFLSHPSHYLSTPLPRTLPRVLPFTECQSMSIEKALRGYDPVALVDDGRLVKPLASHHIVQYGQDYWVFASHNNLQRFCQLPSRYVQKSPSLLPAKLPASQEMGHAPQVTLAHMGEEARRERAKREAQKEEEREEGDLCLGMRKLQQELGNTMAFLNVSLSEAICEALTDVGDRRPVMPHLARDAAALTYVALHLSATNPQNSPSKRKQAMEKFEQFKAQCGLPEALKRKILKRHSTTHHVIAEDTNDRALVSPRDQGESEVERDGAWTEREDRELSKLMDRFDGLFGVSQEESM